MARNQLATLLLIAFTAVACSSPSASSLTVASHSPSPGATGVPLDATVTVVFDQAVDGATVASGFTLTAGGTPVPGVASYDAASRIARFEPTGDLTPDTTHTATMSTAVRGTDGATLASPLTWTFTTAQAGVPATVTIAAPTNGTITANPTPPYVVGDRVTFSANPTSGFTHTGWGGACAAFGAGQDCVLTLTADVTLSATFAAITTPVAFMISQSAGGSVTANRTSPVQSGTQVTFTATPLGGFTHTGWGGACTGATPGQTCTRTVTSPIAVSATFTADPEPETFTFAIDPSAGGDVEANRTSPVASGTQVTFTATPDTGFTHTAWGDACAGEPAGEPCTLTITADVVVSATFTTLPPEEIAVGASVFVPSTTGKGMTIDRPAGLAVGDLLVAHIAYANSGRSINAGDAGWVLIDTNAIAGTLTQFAYYKVATQDDVDAIAQPFSWSVSGAPLTAGAAVSLTHIANADAVDPVFDDASAATTGPGTTIAAPSASTAPAGSLVLALFATTGGFVEAAGAYVVDMTTAYAMPTGAVRLLGVHEILAAEADTGARTATVAVEGLPRIGLTIVLRPN